MALSARSIKNLENVHPVLVRVVHRVAEIAPPFVITEGRRTKERQAELVKRGKSKTMNSRHITGHAIDFVAVVDGGISYDAEHMRPIADAFSKAAGELGVKITRGIDWGWDSPHIELDRKAYPADGKPNSVTEEPKSVSDIPISVTVPAAPVAKSGTVWGSVAGGAAGVAAFFEQSFAAMLEWAAKITELAPAQAAFASMGGNVKSMTLGIGIGAVVYVISRRVKASQEGKPG